jgi:hypothetical protein
MLPLPSSYLHALRSPVHLPLALGSLRAPGVAPSRVRSISELYAREVHKSALLGPACVHPADESRSFQGCVCLEIHDSHGINPMCLSCQTCILCAPALPPVSVMRAAFVTVLVPACNPVACCTCFCREHVPALASALCLTIDSWCPHPCMQSFPYLVSLCRPGGAYACMCLRSCMATPCFPVSGETWRVKPLL